MDQLDNSFDGSDGLDSSSVIADELYGLRNKDHEYQTQQHIKKLSEAFEGCIRSDASQMKVFLRIRPIQSATGNGRSEPPSTIQVNDANTITTMAPDTSKRAQYTKQEERNYMFSRVFPPSTEQADIFREVGKPLLERFIRGESCVLFAYGMTNSGKTHTIQGRNNDPGLLPRLVDHVLAKMTSESQLSTYELHISMLEIYQEKVFDLLSKKRDKLTIRDGNGHVEVVKLSSSAINSSADAVRLLDIAASNRSKANTLLNSGSSRSHAVYTLTLKSASKRTDGTSLPNHTVFHVVDLAGAERSTRTKANFLQLREANNINVSLMQLWRCLQGMKKKVNADGSSSSEMIPYRESKLTHLLMPELGRASVAGVAMVTCVNPQVDDYDETISILGNASLACKITELADIGRPAVAVAPSPAVAPQSTISSIISQFNAAISSSSASSDASSANQKQPLNKRKRDDANTTANGTVAGATSNILSMQAMKRSAQVTTANAAATKAMRKNSVSATASTYAAMMNNTTSSTTAHTSSSSSDDNHDNDEDKRELKRLRREVERLQEDNDKMEMKLQEALAFNDAEVLAATAENVKKRVDPLLQQIKELKDQLKERDQLDADRSSGGSGLSSLSSISNHYSSQVLLRSAKKAKKSHHQRVNEEMYDEYHQLQEDYDELKSSYDGKHIMLLKEKESLQAELQDWKSRAQASDAKLQELQMEVARDLSPSPSARSLTISVEQSDDHMTNGSSKGGKQKKSSSSSGYNKANKKKSSSLRSHAISSMEQKSGESGTSPEMIISQEAEVDAFTYRMNLRSAPTASKRSPLGASNFNNHQQTQQHQPIFPPKSPARTLSPSRSRSPTTAGASKRSVSPASSKAPFVVKAVGNDENSNHPMFGQVSTSAGLQEATTKDGRTVFNRMRSQLTLRA